MFTITLLVKLATVFGSGEDVWVVNVDFTKVIAISKTVTTLQVVSNPILDRTFKFPNGTEFTNPIHRTAWDSLKNLKADLVRYVPWYPYPKKSVAELDSPIQGLATSWDFTNIMPMLEDFMNAVSPTGRTVLNFATQPCWLFGNSAGKPQDCSYPSNPDQSFFEYVRGNRANLLDSSAGDLADYYGRLLAYLVKGEFTDEHGVKHTGGPAYSFFNRQKGHVWELFNEAEHSYTVDQYIHDYDVVVKKMIEAVGGIDNAPAFMGIGGASADWLAPFLNRSRHLSDPAPIDYVSLHFYAGCDNRTDPSTYQKGFFGGAANFVEQMRGYIKVRDNSSFPNVKIDLDELGVILPNDKDVNLPLDANIPDIYWNAAGAMYAFLFSKLAPLGVEVLGHSQLAGSPKIPDWNIPLPQYPSVSLLDWRTGYGNSRYWVLKLLIDNFASGDVFVQTTVQPSLASSLQTDDAVVALGVLRTDQKALLLINPTNALQSVRLVGWSVNVALQIVDPKSVQRSSAQGIRLAESPSALLTMEPFSVMVATERNQIYV